VLITAVKKFYKAGQVETKKILLSASKLIVSVNPFFAKTKGKIIKNMTMNGAATKDQMTFLRSMVSWSN
jgi:hypothetical protein